MLHDMRKSVNHKNVMNQTTISNLNLSRQNGNPQSIQQNGSTQIVSNYSNDQNKVSLSQPLHKGQSNAHILQRDIQTQRLIDIKKVNKIQQQERQIERVAEQLITLKEVIRKLKINIGVMVQQQLQEQSELHYYNERSDHNLSESDLPLQKAMRKLQKLNDRRITPEYRQWIEQYFNKIFSDIKQIKTQFLNYQRAKRKNQNNLDLSDSKISLGLEKSKPYQNLIEFQIKCKLLECVLKLCKSKGIFNSSDYIKYSQELESISIEQLTENLQKYKMNNICQKVNTLHLKRSSPQELFYQWKTIHDQLEIVNLQEIQRFYQEKKELAYLGGGYENNQNGILIIGGSGVGKTTLFLSMAGEKMIKRKIKSRNCQFQNYQAADQQIANHYKTSPFSTSCTREPAKLQAPKKFTFPQELCLIDTAGFQQSRSGQIDIMNTLYTYQTIQEMKKLRIVIVISQKNIGERDQGLNKFAKNIARYFRDYEQVRESILFVLTKFDNAKRLKISCDQLLKTINGHKDTNEYKFVKHLQQSIVYKECIEFRPTDQNIVFDAEYHIDPVEMDTKLKKLYKALLKRFPIHHQYQNDYINLEYSRQTKDKLIQKKCYLQNMIRKLYKQGNNSFRFYLQQLMFLQNKINKIQFTSSKAKGGKYANVETQNTFDILTFIQQINQEVLTKFNTLLEEYFIDCKDETLREIIELKNRYSNLFLGNVDIMTESSQAMEEEYLYIFQQITQSINSLKVEFEKIVEEKHKQVNKLMKHKPKSCHDIKNKKWLCAVMNFTKQYYTQSKQLFFFSNNDDNLLIKDEYDEGQNRVKQKKNKQKNNKKNKIIKQPLVMNKQYKALIKTLKKNQQKFRQQFQQQLSIMDQEITTHLIKKSSDPNLSNDFLIQTQKQINQTYTNFKKLCFHTYFIDSKTSEVRIPSDEQVYQSNLQYIVSILKQNLDKQFSEITQNIQLMQLINHSLKDSDPDISRNVFQQVQRYSQKIRMYYSCDKQIYDLMQGFYNRVMKKVNIVVKEINQRMFEITKKQAEQEIKVVEITSELLPITFSAVPQAASHIKPLVKLSPNLLYCYLSKINELQQFPELKKQMEFQIRCFNLKLRDYVINLEKYLAKYDEKLSIFKNLVKKQKAAGKMTSISLEIYTKIKQYVEQCIQIQHQIKLVHHYFRNQQTKQNVFKFEHLGYIKSICYRHSRFLQSEKKSIRQAYELNQKLESTQLPLDLVIDYVILEEIYIQKIKFDDSQEFKKLHNAYENSYIATQSEFLNEFQDMKTHQLKMLNQCKHRILDKLLEYPAQIDAADLDKIQNEQFQLTFQPGPIRKTAQIFLYYVQMKQIFQDIQTLNNQQVSHDFRVIQLSDMSSPIQTIQQNVGNLSNLLITITQIANLKYSQLKEALQMVILDDFYKMQVINYLKGCHILCILFDKLEQSSLQGLQLLQESLQSFKRKNLFNQMKEFVDKCESIFYKLSKNIDSIELEHFENVSQVLQRPQSTKQFLKLLKSQCVYFGQSFNGLTFNGLETQMLTSLKDLLKKMQQSENQLDSLWQDELKQLEKSSKDSKNSLHKLIKLYQQHITKTSTQKTLQYRFVELKKQQLANQIKEFLNDPVAENKVQKGQALCQQLKNYLNFLKSMKFKMVVNLNSMDEIKNIQEMQRLYEKEATKSQAQKSQTDMTPSQLRQNYLSIDYIQRKRDDSDRYSISEIKTSRFGSLGIEQKQRPHQRKSAMKNSQIWQQKSNDVSQTSQTSHTPKRGAHMDNSFTGIVDDWSKQMAVNTMDSKAQRLQLAKSQSGLQIRNNKIPDMTASSPNIEMTKSGIDHLKRYTINGPITNETQNQVTNMKKSSINLKYAPPVLTYQESDKKIISNPSNVVEKLPLTKQSQLANSTSNTSLALNNQLNNPQTRIMSKHKTEAKINY